jgi:RNA polymerase sigma factor (TIGR02999 family)
MGTQEIEVKQPPGGEVSRLLTAWSAGKPGADERLFSAIYAELRKLAASHRRGEGPAHSLQTTALVHEAYLRLNRQHEVAWKNRGHFFALASQAMRRILVDHARCRKAAKRGGAVAPSPLDAIVVAAADPVDLVELDVALEKLERIDPQEAKGGGAPLLRRPDGVRGGRGAGGLARDRRARQGHGARVAPPRARPGRRRPCMTATTG